MSRVLRDWDPSACRRWAESAKPGTKVRARRDEVFTALLELRLAAKRCEELDLCLECGSLDGSRCTCWNDE